MYTTNNSTSMKTEVETYVIEETQELIYDNEKLDQWNKHVQELGLEGQTQIVKPDKSPIPFLHMKEALVNVFSTLCPRKVGVKEYNKTPIPVEILDLVALSSRENYFDKVQVWYDEETPDPAVIGFKLKPEYLNTERSWEWEGYYEKYLIGRWADVKQSLEQLTAKARVLFMKSRKSQYEQQLRDTKRQLEDLETEADRTFGFGASDNGKDLPF